MNENRKKTRFYVDYFLKLCNRYIDTWVFIILLFLFLYMFDFLHSNVLKYFVIFFFVIFFCKNGAECPIEHWYFEFSIPKQLEKNLNVKASCSNLVVKSCGKESRLSVMVIPLRSWNNPIWRIKMSFWVFRRRVKFVRKPKITLILY